MSEPDDECQCEFDYPADGGEESYHYTRTCRACGGEWGSLHCPHDGVQNKCPHCAWRDPGTRTPLEFLGFQQQP